MTVPGVERVRQRVAFAKAGRRFAKIYAGVEPLEAAAFVTPYWTRLNREVATHLLPVPSHKFLRDPLIAGNMVVDQPRLWLRDELAFLEAHAPRGTLRQMLREEYIGGAPLVTGDYRTSHNVIHHAYHLVRFWESVGVPPWGVRTIVEWGGGYGNLARIITRSRASDQTYVIVDNPTFTAIQWLYLSSILGDTAVNVVTDRRRGVVSGAVNLVPTGLLDVVDGLDVDLFISTWALSESEPPALEHVVSRNWYGASHLLIAYRDVESQDFPAQTRIRSQMEAKGATVAEISFLPGEFYAFC
jgi:hypothetical protein